jgi:hypothetical protein
MSRFPLEVLNLISSYVPRPAYVAELKAQCSSTCLCCVVAFHKQSLEYVTLHRVTVDAAFQKTVFFDEPLYVCSGCIRTPLIRMWLLDEQWFTFRVARDGTRHAVDEIRGLDDYETAQAVRAKYGLFLPGVYFQYFSFRIPDGTSGIGMYQIRSVEDFPMEWIVPARSRVPFFSIARAFALFHWTPTLWPEWLQARFSELVKEARIRDRGREDCMLWPQRRLRRFPAALRAHQAWLRHVLEKPAGQPPQKKKRV